MKQNKKRVVGKTAIKIIAIIVAFVCWVLVVMTGTTSKNETVRNIPIDLERQEKVLAELGLNIIEVSASEVSAEISGERVTVGNVLPEDLLATVQLPIDISGPDNTYTLELVPQNSTVTQSKNFKIVKYVPESITIKLDRIEKKSVPIVANVEGEIKLSEGYIQEKDMVITPDQVSVSGPKVELDKIDKAVINMKVEGELQRTFAGEYDIALLDVQGNEINLEERHLSLDNDNVQVVISVLKEKELPLSVEFINVPRNFPIEELKNFELSNKSVSVAGPVDSVDKYNEIVLGYIDVSQISKNKDSFNFEVNLPDKFVNLDNVYIATVKMSSESWAETVLDVSEINIINAPEGFEIKLVTEQVSNVKMVGDAGLINNLTSEDLVAELDLAQKKDIAAGQYQDIIKISAPAKGLVWASGEYNVVIKVIETDVDV